MEKSVQQTLFHPIEQRKKSGKRAFKHLELIAGQSMQADELLCQAIIVKTGTLKWGDKSWEINLIQILPIKNGA